MCGERSMGRFKLLFKSAAVGPELREASEPLIEAGGVVHLEAQP
jgi:hypothetical protein